MLDSAIVGLIVVAGALAIAFISHSELSSLLKSAIDARYKTDPRCIVLGF
jgi:hypothetical protein